MTRRCLPPVVVELGITRAAHLAALRVGEGPLVEEVARAQRLVLDALSASVSGKIILPVVVAYRRPAKVSRSLGTIPER